MFWFGVSMVSGFLLAGVELILAFSLGLLLSSLGISIQTPELPWGLGQIALSPKHFVFLLIGIGLVRAILQFFVYQSSSFSTHVIALRLKQILAFKYFMREKPEGSVSEFNHYNSEIFSKCNGFCSSLMLGAPVLIQALVLIGVLFYKSYLLTTAGLLGIGFAGLLVTSASKSIVHLATKIRDIDSTWQKRMVRSIRNWFMLRALRLTEQEYQRISGDQFTYTGLNLRSIYFSNLAGTLPQFLGVIVITGLIGIQLKYQLMTGMSFFAYLYLFLRFVQALSSSVGQYGSLVGSYPQFKTAVQFFFAFSPQEIEASLCEVKRQRLTGSNWESVAREAFPDTHKKIKRVPHGTLPDVKVSHVSYSYHSGFEHSDERLVLKNVSLIVPSSTSVAIVGPSGSGKSTLLALILGVLKPVQGSVSIGGMPPEEYFKAHPHSVGYVGADPYLIEGTLRENLLYGNPFEVSDSEVIKALSLAHLGSWFEKNPLGLDYALTENGEGLSTGQKQRLSLARAFLLKPALLILDEVSANLDTATEAEIANTLKQMNYDSTIVIVSHRAGLVEHVSNRLDLSVKA